MQHDLNAKNTGIIIVENLAHSAVKCITPVPVEIMQIMDEISYNISVTAVFVHFFILFSPPIASFYPEANSTDLNDERLKKELTRVKIIEFGCHRGLKLYFTLLYKNRKSNSTN